MQRSTRVGILTYHRVSNPGALLQAYGVEQSLREALSGASVEVVDYRPWLGELRERGQCLRWRFPFLIWPNIANLMRMRRFLRDDLTVSDDHLTTDDRARALEFLEERYDVLVSGSDCVWEIHEEAWASKFPSVPTGSDGASRRRRSLTP